MPTGHNSFLHTVVSPRLSVWSRWLNALPYGHRVGPLQGSMESHPVVLPLRAQTWLTHAGPQRRDGELPEWGMEGNRKECAQKKSHISRILLLLLS